MGGIMSHLTLDKLNTKKNALEIWGRLLKKLGDEMPHSKFEAWIRPIVPVDIEKKTFIIATNDILSKEWISKNHQAQIEEGLKEVSGKKFSLQIILKREVSDLDESTTLIERKPLELKREPLELPKVDEFHINAMKSTSCNLNLKYTFNSFVVGDNNRFAYEACMAVAKNPAKNHNPLFIYGGSGLGKTHLMQSIGHYILVNHPNLKVRYTNTEAFMNELVKGIMSGKDSNAKMSEFRQKYRHVDVLLIDDIQFLENKKATQDEIFHTFEFLYNSGKQIVITSDRPPKAIPTLTDRLRSRFEWGLLTDIQVPDFDMRVKILEERAKKESVKIGRDVSEFVANTYQANVRELEGALNRLMAYSSIRNIPIDLKMATSVIDTASLRPNLTIEKIIEITSSFFGVSKEEMKSPSKSKDIALARQVGVYLTRDMIKASFPAIGAGFGGRKHTTIMHSFEKIKTQMQSDLALKEQVSDLTRLISQKYSR